jgi:type IV secretory pathway VirB10-like protein
MIPGKPPSASPNTLLKPKAKRRLATLNFGMIFIVVGLVGAIGLAVVFGVSQMNATPTANTVVDGAPVTQGASQQDLGMTGPTYSDPAPEQDTAVVRTVVRTAPTDARAPRATQAPQPVSNAGAGGSSAEDEAATQAREARRQAAENAREQLRRRQERVDAAMRSLGGVTVVDEHSNDRNVASNGAQNDAAGADAAGSNETREYAPPSGPVLALDTSIPVELKRSVDSTFGGQFEVRVTDDVHDETGQTVIIPRDTRCYGSASPGGVDGQARLYSSFDLCKFPDRERLVLDHFPAIDADGATGIKARVDDHGAGRRGRASALSSAPGMLLGTVIPGAGGITGAAYSAQSIAQASQVGRAIPGPTLYLDASDQHPRSFSILVTHDTAIHAYTSPSANTVSEAKQ